MDAKIARGETAAHRELKRLAALWAQAQGYAACAMEVTLPKCRYRADVAAFRLTSDGEMCSAIFECKQARPDLRRDNCCTTTARERLATVHRRRQVIEKHLRVHYPALRHRDSLFAEFDSHDFQAIGHRTYSRLVRELAALQNQLNLGTKFEKLRRYRCANLYFLVLPNELFCPAEIPAGWGALIEHEHSLSVALKPTWNETTSAAQLNFLYRIAAAETRRLNKKIALDFETILSQRRRSIA